MADDGSVHEFRGFRMYGAPDPTLQWFLQQVCITIRLFSATRLPAVM